MVDVSPTSAIRRDPRRRPRAPGSALGVSPGLAVLGAWILLAAACGPGEPPTGRFAVQQRDFSWERTSGVDVVPLSLEWDFASDGQWVGELAGVADGLLIARGRGTATLTGPRQAPIDPDLHHTLIVEARTTGVESLAVGWRREGEDFLKGATSSRMPIASDGELNVYSIPLSSLRGVVLQEDDGPRPRFTKAADASEGVAEFQLLFAGAEGEPLKVEIARIALTSNFDVPVEGSIARQAHFGRRGIYRHGILLRVSGAVATDVVPGPWDRLRLGLALAGTDDPVTVRLRDADGRLPETSWVLEPGADWLEAAVDLSPLEGQPTRLMLEADGTDDARATVMVGGVLRLAREERELPTIVLYIEDTLRADRLGTYGYEQPTDPHLQAIAEQGVVFERMFAASNWTRPSITTLHTSLDPLRHGNRVHTLRVVDDVTTIAEALADAGYLTTSFVTNYHGGEWSGLDQGVDVAREPPAYRSSDSRSTLTSGIIAEPLGEELRRHADERLFVLVHTLDPHQPYKPEGDEIYEPQENHRYLMMRSGVPRPPKGQDSRAEQRYRHSLAYDAEIHHNDRLLARLDDDLSAAGLLDDTLLVFVSDHGEGFDEHGLNGHRQTLYQEELHVPWVLRWPGELPAGTRIDAIAGHVDVGPTILGLAGLEPPTGWRGRDLSGLLRGGELPPAARDVRLLIDSVYDNKGDGIGERESVAVVTSDYKLIADLDPETRVPVPRELYDLGSDPGETVNVLDDPAHERQRDALTEWLVSAVAEALAASGATAASGMDLATQEWMRAMGYLGPGTTGK